MKKLSLILASALASGCAYMPKADGERLANEVFALQSQMAAFQQSLTALKKEEARLSAQIDDMRKASGRNDADLGVELDGTRQHVAEMRGRIEGFAERLSMLEAQNAALVAEKEQAAQAEAEAQKLLAAKSEAEREAAAKAKADREKLLKSPSQALREVRALLAKKKSAEARQVLRELSAKHKKDKRFDSRYGAELQYLIGESYFLQGNYQQAAAEYNTVRKAYGASSQAPDAMYQLGRCFEALKLKADAKIFYDSVIKKHPKSAAARKAKKRLLSL